MSKKDKQQSDRFNNPFSALKGLSVSGQGKPPAAEKPAAVSAPRVEPAAPIAEELLFAQAMGELGVHQSDADARLEKPLPAHSQDPPYFDAQTQVGSGPPGGARRQVRKIARRIGEPEATLDLHGIAAADAIRKVEWFLENAVFHGSRSVLIITGKGEHSEAGAVLRPLVEAYLSGPGRRFASSWVSAPKNRGGAFLVELQQ